MNYVKLTTYGQGGYSQNLSFNKSINIYIIKELKSFRWIDQGTRLVTIGQFKKKYLILTKTKTLKKRYFLIQNFLLTMQM